MHPMGWHLLRMAWRSITLDNAGHVGIFEDLPKNMLDVHGKMSIGHKQEAPTNGLIVKEIVGIGFDYLSDMKMMFEIR